MITKKDIEYQFITVSRSALNTMQLADEPAYQEPVAAYGDGDDPLFAFYKQDISPTECILPDEWLALKYGRAFDPACITVISYALPQTIVTRQSNAEETTFPSPRWSLNRTFGEQYNRKLGKLIEDYLDSCGVEAVAPIAHEKFSWITSEKYGYASNWSERHAAFICGHGTFGLCDGLISKQGKAARFGSIIANIRLPKTPRDYSDPYEYCLADQGCTGCIDRCPIGAITKKGHDKKRCHDYQVGAAHKNARKTFDFDGSFGCGLCQTGVPCQDGRPSV